MDIRVLFTYPVSTYVLMFDRNPIRLEILSELHTNVHSFDLCYQI